MKRLSSSLHLNSEGEEQPEMIYPLEIGFKAKRSSNLECRVCDAPAHGYNFDQISCESCKAFFRRNALKEMSDFTCRFFGSCKITIESRRQCTYCRLKKCFDVNMKKEWIRTEEERRIRKLKRIYKQQKKINTHLDRQTMERKKNKFNLITTISNQFIHYKQPILRMNRSFSGQNLTYDDWSVINNVSHAYDIWALECDTSHINNYSLIKTSLQDFLNDEQQMYRSLIQFYKQIPEFKQTNVEDQILLIKCNITHLVHIHHILKDHFIENEKIGLHMSKWINPDFHKRMSKTRHSFDCFIENPIVLKLSLVTFMFVINLSRLPYHQLSFQLTEKNFLNEHQNYYITLLWKYLNVIFIEPDAIKAIQRIVFQFLRYQLLMNEMETIVIKQNNLDQFHPLTKSVLRLT